MERRGFLGALAALVASPFVAKVAAKRAPDTLTVRLSGSTITARVNGVRLPLGPGPHVDNFFVDDFDRAESIGANEWGVVRGSWGITDRAVASDLTAPSALVSPPHYS